MSIGELLDQTRDLLVQLKQYLENHRAGQTRRMGCYCCECQRLTIRKNKIYIHGLMILSSTCCYVIECSSLAEQKSCRCRTTRVPNAAVKEKHQGKRKRKTTSNICTFAKMTILRRARQLAIGLPASVRLHTSLQRTLHPLMPLLAPDIDIYTPAHQSPFEQLYE
jgi:hypothetical protein